MNRTIQTFRYLMKSFSILTGIAFLSILGNVAVTNLVFHLTDRSYNTVHQTVPLTAPLEATAGVFALITGMILFLINFKVALANGVSRTTFLLANLPAAALMAGVLALFNVIVLLIHRLFWPLMLTSHLFYPNIGLVGLLLVQFAQYFLFMVAGWLISLAYYRSSVSGKWAISLAPFALFGLTQIINAQTNGVLYHAFRDFFLLTLRSAPSTAVISLLAYSAILSGIVYLLIRRAPLKG